MPAFSSRTQAKEWMDDYSITDERLIRALEDLRTVNRWLGGYGAVRSALGPFLQQLSTSSIRILDLGTGIADIPEHLMQWADRRDRSMEIVAVDANPATIDYARRSLRRRLGSKRASRIHLKTADVLSLPYEENAFDVCLASLFLHHLNDDQIVEVLQMMERLGRYGLVVNDLHRSRMAYYGFQLITRLWAASDMVRHDGLVSVLRGFRRDELERYARIAGLDSFEIRWHWAFRWTLSTLPV